MRLTWFGWLLVIAFVFMFALNPLTTLLCVLILVTIVFLVKKIFT